MDKYEPTFIITRISARTSLTCREIHLMRYAERTLKDRILKMNLYDIFEIIKNEAKKVNDAHPTCIPLSVSLIEDEVFRTTIAIRRKSTEPSFVIKMMDIGGFPLFTKEEIEQKK